MITLRSFLLLADQVNQIYTANVPGRVKMDLLCSGDQRKLLADLHDLECPYERYMTEVQWMSEFQDTVQTRAAHYRTILENVDAC